MATITYYRDSPPNAQTLAIIAARGDTVEYIDRPGAPAVEPPPPEVIIEPPLPEPPPPPPVIIVAPPPAEPPTRVPISGGEQPHVPVAPPPPPSGRVITYYRDSPPDAATLAIIAARGDTVEYIDRPGQPTERISEGEIIIVDPAPRENPPIAEGEQAIGSPAEPPPTITPSTGPRVSEGEPVIIVDPTPRENPPIAGGEQPHEPTPPPPTAPAPSGRVITYYRDSPPDAETIRIITERGDTIEYIDRPAAPEPYEPAVVIVDNSPNTLAPTTTQTQDPGGTEPAVVIDTPPPPPPQEPDQPVVVIDPPPAEPDHTGDSVTTTAPTGDGTGTTPPTPTGETPGTETTPPEARETVWPDLDQLIALLPTPARAVAQNVKQAAEAAPWWMWPAAALGLALMSHGNGRKRR